MQERGTANTEVWKGCEMYRKERLKTLGVYISQKSGGGGGR